MQTVEHDGRATAYRVVEGDGQSPTTLYVHGSGGSHQAWANQYGLKGPAHPASALDLSGHGESDDLGIDEVLDDGTFGDEVLDDEVLNEEAMDDIAVLDVYARDVVAVAEAADADILVGNSLGGAIVLQIALDGQFDPAAIVLAGTGASLPVDENLRSLLADDFETAIDVLHGDDVLLHDADEQTLSRSRQTMRAAGQAVVRRDFLACHGFDVRDRLDTIDVPALAVVGEYDRLAPPESHRTLADEMANCRYREIADAAHLAMLDQPEAFNSALAEFFDEIR